VGGLGCGWAKLNVVFLCWLLRWQNTSFNFAKRGHFPHSFLSVYCLVVGRPTLACNSQIYATAQNKTYANQIKIVGLTQLWVNNGSLFLKSIYQMT
jgi:hypothetical protein